MKFIDKQLGTLLFDRVEETIQNDALTPKEKIPKYRAILDDFKKEENINFAYPTYRIVR